MKKVARSTRDSRVVVAIAGFFDPIHDGHLDHVEKAKALGDYLVAFVGTEAQVAQKNGVGAWLTYEGKCRILLKFGVDRCVPSILDEVGSCAKSLCQETPDIFAQGGNEPIHPREQDACDEIGCRVVYGVGDRLNRSGLFWNGR